MAARLVCYSDLRDALWLSKGSLAVLLVADLFHPVHHLTIERLLNGDVRQGGRWRGAVPMLFAGREANDVARMDFFDWTTFALGPTATGGNNEGLAQRMGVPGGPGAGFKRDIGGRNPSKMFQRGCAGKRVACGKSRKNWKTISAAGGGRRRSLILCLRQC